MRRSPRGKLIGCVSPEDPTLPLGTGWALVLPVVEEDAVEYSRKKNAGVK
jgi:hypothetical protein